MPSRFVQTLVFAAAALLALPIAAQDAPRLTPPTVQNAAAAGLWSDVLAHGVQNAEGARAYTEFRTAMAELGVREMPAHAAVLLGQAAEQLERGERAAAESLRDRAEELAPRSAEPRFFAAYIRWRTEPWNVPAIVRESAAGVAAMTSSVRGGFAWRAQALTLLLLASCLFALLASLGIVVAHGGRVAHDLRLVLRRGPTVPQSTALVGVAVFAPAVLFWSPLLFVASAWAVTFAHLRRSERVVGVLVAAFLALTPSIADRTVVAVLGAPGGETSVNIERPCGVRCVEQLDAQSAHGDVAAQVARAWVHYLGGNADQRRRAAAALEAMTASEVSPGVAASLRVLRGNLSFAEGDLDAAETSYRDAYEVAVSNRQRAAAMLNLYRVYSAQGLEGSAQEAMSAARRFDAALAEEAERYTGTSQNRLLASAAPVPAMVPPDPDSRAQAIARLTDAWVGAVPLTMSPLLAILVVLLIALGIVPAVRQWTSRRCACCASPVSRFVLTPAYDAARCVLCFQLDTARHEMRARRVRAREERIEAWVEAAPKLGWIANIAVPGLGLLAAGWTVTGSLASALFGFGIACWLVPGAAVSQPYALTEGAGFDGFSVLGGLCVAVAYAVALGLTPRACRVGPTEAK